MRIRSNYGSNSKRKKLDVATDEVNSKLLEYEKNHKNGSGQYYTVGEVNEKIEKIIPKYAK